MTGAQKIRNAVVDASVIVDFLLRTRDATVLVALLEDPRIDLHTPGLCDVETAAAVRAALLRGRLESPEQAALLLDDLDGMPVVRYDHGPLLRRVLELRDNFSAYDATYVALAEALGASLVTADARLAAATRRNTCVDAHLTIP